MVRGVLTATAAALALALAAPAWGANSRVAISNYQWSKPEVHLDLGEHVTWYWTGPDTMHSVTGTSANALQWDSEGGDPVPRHDLGDTYQVTFDQPGTYDFVCKLHAVVRGTVVVSDTPGDPLAEPDAVPQINVDAEPPRMSEVRLAATRFGRAGTTLHLALNERAHLDAEIWRLRRHRHGRRFAGWQEWSGHIGYNDVRFGARSEHFTPRRGRYVALLSATDAAHNAGADERLRFTIR